MFFQTLSSFSPLNHLNTKSTFQFQSQTETPLNTNLIGGAGNYGNKNNGIILLHQGQYNSLRSGFGSNNSTLHGNVNILLGGAMLSVVIIILCIACYCCHRNIKKRTESAYRQRWLDNDDNMEIYSVEQCYESSGLFMTSNDHIPTLSHEPPPSYDAVILNEIANRASPPPGYRSTNSINNNNNNNDEYLTEISIRKHYNYDDECNRITNNRILRTSQSVCSLERAQNQYIVDEMNSIETISSSSDQNSFYTNNILNGKQFSVNNNNNNNTNNITLYSKLKSNSSSIDSGLDILVNVLNQQHIESSLSDISPSSIPSTSFCIENSIDYNQNNNLHGHIDNINQLNDNDNNLMDLLTNEEQNYKNNNIVENLLTNIRNSTDNICSNDSDNNNNVNLDCINENGIIRIDMSQIIDTTGLPTYDAALKLESIGYV